MKKDDRRIVAKYFHDRSKHWNSYKEFIDPDNKIKPLTIMLLRTSFFVGIDSGIDMIIGGDIVEREIDDTTD